MRSLRGIAVSHTLVTDVGVIKLAEGLPKLSILNMSDCPGMTGRMLPYVFHHLPLLEQLFIAGCQNIRENNFDEFEAGGDIEPGTEKEKGKGKEKGKEKETEPQVAYERIKQKKKFPALQALLMGGCTGVSDELVMELIARTPNLQTLLLRYSRSHSHPLAEPQSIFSVVVHSCLKLPYCPSLSVVKTFNC